MYFLDGEIVYSLAGETMYSLDGKMSKIILFTSLCVRDMALDRGGFCLQKIENLNNAGAKNFLSV